MAAFAGLAALLADHRGARGEVRATLATADGEATILLGRDFLLDAELADHVGALHGIVATTLKTSDIARLALVG